MERSHHKRTKTQSLDPLPTDLVVEILKRLPTKSVAKLLLVSKSWETIIRSREFIRSFPLRSSSPCFLLAYNQNDDQTKRKNWFFFSSTRINQTVPDLISRMSFHVSKLQCYIDTHQYTHGLMYLVYGQDQVITNPSIGKSITLPRLISRREVVKRFLGYDPVDDEYKVLCIVKAMYGSGTRVAPSGHQILTLGSSSKWRNIEFINPHHPISRGLCIDGVLCYLAYMGNNVMGHLSLARFEVRSEQSSFVTTTVSKNLDRPWFVPYLVRYMAKVAIANQTSWYTFDLWVLEDAKKHAWSKICLSLHPWNNMSWIYPLCIVGTAHTGEIILTYYDIRGGLHVIYHDLKKNSQRQVEIQGMANYNVRLFGTPLCFVDHIESVMLL